MNHWMTFPGTSQYREERSTVTPGILSRLARVIAAPHESQYVLVNVVFPKRLEIVVRGFLPAPVVRVTVVLPLLVLVVIRGPVFVYRMVVLPITVPSFN